MKNILNEKDRKEVLQRIQNISMESSRLWGKMNANEMLCHSADQIRLALGEKSSLFVGNAFLTTFFKTLVLWGVPAPKGKVETVKELKQGAEGTPVTSFSSDKESLIDSIEKFVTKTPDNMNVVHPAFGNLSYKQWGRLIYIHLDHHLKQFSS
jgi:hypothetical protein